MDDDYSEDPDWEYGFQSDDAMTREGKPLIFARVFGVLPFTSIASVKHTASKSYWDHYELFRHPKGSLRDDDWEPVPEGDKR